MESGRGGRGTLEEGGRPEKEKEEGGGVRGRLKGGEGKGSVKQGSR